MTDVLVLGAGLAGLAAARDLANGGAGVTVLEARERVGGRVEQVRIDEGRPLQLGGEVVGTFHTAYLGLVEELGLTLQPSYTGLDGQTTYDLPEGVQRADDWPFATAAERDDYERVERLYGALVATVDPADPWSHPEARALDVISVGAWLRSVGALPAVIRCLEAGTLALADGSNERTSLLAELRKSAAAGEEGFYGYARWESLQVTEGSAEVAERMAAELGGRIRFGAVVEAISISPSGCVVRLAGGEELSAAAVVCALPVGVLDRDRDRRCRPGAAGIAPRPADGACGQGGRRLRPLVLDRRRRERPLRRRRRAGLDLGAARGRALRARAAGADRAPSGNVPRRTASGSFTTSWSGCTVARRARAEPCTYGCGRPTRTRAGTSRTGGRAT